MRTGLVFLTCLSLVGTAHAAPVTLICNGSLTADGKTTNISAETAIVDLEKNTFKPPLYPEFPLIRVGESDLSFASELPTLSTWEGLDRVSWLFPGVSIPRDLVANSCSGIRANSFTFRGDTIGNGRLFCNLTRIGH
jgi:hypothetical protein